MNMCDITSLRERISYDPMTGVFTWLKGRNAGKPAGTLHRTGYIFIHLYAQKKAPAQRVAIALMTGEWPAKDVDHINGVRSDNRWGNLREAGERLNRVNSITRRRVNLLPRGVVPRGRKFAAYIKNGPRSMKYLGIYETPELAHEAFMLVARAAYGEYLPEQPNYIPLSG